MSSVKFSPKEKVQEQELSWTVVGEKKKAYTVPGQRKQTVIEAFPALGNSCNTKPTFGLNFLEKALNTVENDNKATVIQMEKKAEEERLKVSNTCTSSENTMFANNSHSNYLKKVNDREKNAWRQRRLYSSSDDEERKSYSTTPDEEEFFDDYSDEENDEAEVYNAGEFDRHT